MLQVGPSDVSGKLAEWADALGIPIPDSFATLPIPSWLPWAFWIVVASILFWPEISHLLLGKEEQNIPPKLVQTDFAMIDQKHSFMIYELACFWVGEKADLPLSKKAKKQFKKFETAAKANKLKVASSTSREAIEKASNFIEFGVRPDLNPYWTVNRDEVMVYANRVKQRPAFLYRQNRVHG